MLGAARTAQDAAVNLTRGDVQKSIRFYTEGLGFEIVHKMENEGKIPYVMMRAGGAGAGLKLDNGPAKLEWGPMAFAVTDPDGFKLTVSRPMAP